MSNPGLYEWMALRRVHEGGVAKSAGAYFDHAHPTAGHLTEVFDRLIWTGLVTVADGDPIWALRRLSLTDAGQVRYAVLSECQRDNLQEPPPEHGTATQTPAGRRPSATPLAPPGGWTDPARTARSRWS